MYIYNTIGHDNWWEINRVPVLCWQLQWLTLRQPLMTKIDGKVFLICLKTVSKFCWWKKSMWRDRIYSSSSCKECMGNKCNKIMWIWLTFTQWPQIEDWLSRGEIWRWLVIFEHGLLIPFSFFHFFSCLNEWPDLSNNKICVWHNHFNMRLDFKMFFHPYM